MAKNIFSIFSAFILCALTFISCSSNDDEVNTNNSFVIDDEKCSIHSATCSFHGTITDILGEFEIPPHGAFSMQFIFDETLHIFSFSIDELSSYDVINIGENFVSDGAVDVNEFRRLTAIELSTRYKEEDGKLTITEKGSDYVIVSFDNFSFVKDTGNSESQYTINGKVKFIDII